MDKGTRKKMTLTYNDFQIRVTQNPCY